MILVLSGTRDGGEIIRMLRKRGYSVLATATTAYGASLAREAGAGEALEGQLTSEEMVSLIKEKGVSALVDATHPFATEASRNALRACRDTGVRYLRFERKGTTMPENPLIHLCESMDEGAAKAASLGDVIFCAIGSRHLKPFVEAVRKKRRRLTAKVLPTREALEKCAALGLEPKNILAIQGPGSYQLNKTLLKDYNADVLVTKESGSVGGEDAKIKAALSLGIPTVLIARPKLEYPIIVEEYREVLSWLEDGR